MKEIILTQGKNALVDDDDFDYLNSFKWYAVNNKNSGYYAVRHNNNVKTRYLIRMHRFILNPPKDKVVDHINGNGLDNRKCNLRICTQSENTMNSRLSSANKSGHRGIHYRKDTKKWRASISIKNKKIDLGSYFKIEEAIEVRKKASIFYHKEYAKLK